MANTRHEIIIRVWIISVTFILLGLLIIWKMLAIQIYERKDLLSMSNNKKLRDTTVMPVRGNILTWDGNLLATSIPSYDIKIDFRGIAWTNKNIDNEIDTIARNLEIIFKDKSTSYYKEILFREVKKKNKYFSFRNDVDLDQLKALRKLPVFRLDIYKSGLYIIEKAKRSQPFQPLAQRIIGPAFLEKGKYGIENSFDSFLTGKVGRRLEQNIGGIWIPVNHENELDPVDGNDIITTLDIPIQELTQNALQKGMEAHKADTGCAIVMEVETGKILAISNLTRKPDGRYIEDYNYAFESRNEPGSTFKLVSAIILLENNFVNPSSEVDTKNGEWVIYGDTIRDSKKGGHGKITFKEAFEVSSNIAFAKFVNFNFSNKKDLFYKGMQKMHMTEPLKISIKGECRPKIDSSKKWVKSTLVYLSHGYGIDLTPLHILTLYNAVANKGKMMKPMFVTEIKHAGQTLIKYEPEVLVDKICSDKTLVTVQTFLTGVIESKDGTAHKIRTDKYQIAGKTGTAKRVSKGRYLKNYRASFVGFFPADNPKYSCIVVIDNPKGGDIYGATVAAPVFREIADKLYGSEIQNKLPVQNEPLSFAINNNAVSKATWSDYQAISKMLGLNIHSNSDSNEWAVLRGNQADPELVGWKNEENTVPDVRGMVITDAVYLLENLGYTVEYSKGGFGLVATQSIPPGKKIKSKVTIRLTLGKK